METKELLLDMQESHKTILLDILDRLVPAGLEVWAFGSRARWTARETSDLDLALRNPAQLETRLEVGILDDLKEAFEESDLPFMVDLLDWATVSDKFRKVIEREYVVVKKRRGGVMALKTVSFLELLSEIVDNRGKTCPTSETGIPLIATNCVRNDSLYPLFEKVRYIDEEIHKNWFRGHPKPGDVLFVTKGTPGRVCWVPDPVNFCIAQDMLSIRANEEIVCPKFLFALLRSAETQKMIENMHVGTLIPHFKKGDFNQLYLSIPTDRKVQARIGDIYFNISEKIELNRQTNQTLEAIAQALFKEWFVDFNFPGATGAMQESDLGPIPAGWKVGQLDDVLVLQRGFDLPANTRISGKYPVIAASGPSGTHNEFKATGPGVVTGRSGVLGKVFFVHEDFWPLNTSLWIKEYKNSTPLFAFYLLQGLDLGSFNAGSAVPTLNRNHVHNLPVLLPPMEVIRSFDKLVMPLKKRQRVHEDETISLVTTRDTLLPKLMNGEIAV